MCKMVGCGSVGHRPLCRNQINSKNARMSQAIDQKGRWQAGKGDRYVYRYTVHRPYNISTVLEFPYS